MGICDLSITAFLIEISTRLNTVAARPRAAPGCAQSGSKGEALHIAMDVSEAKMLHGAMRLTGRRRRGDARQGLR